MRERNRKREVFRGFSQVRNSRQIIFAAAGQREGAFSCGKTLGKNRRNLSGAPKQH